MYDKITLSEISPYVRFVNNFGGSYDYVQPDRILYDYEMMYIMEGSITIYYDGIKYELHKSDLLFFRPGITNHMEMNGKVELKTHCIHFDWIPPREKENFLAEEFYLTSFLSSTCRDRLPTLKNRYTPEPDDFTIPTCIHNLNYDIFAPLFLNCYRSFLNNTPISHFETANLFGALILALYHFLNTSFSNMEHPKIKQALNYIHANYKSRISVKDLAMQLGLSPKYFGTIFKNSTGKSVNEFVSMLRLNDAKQLLISSNMRMEEISDLLGYSNEFYFSKRFKESEGMSPKQYRELILTSNTSGFKL